VGSSKLFDFNSHRCSDKALAGKHSDAREAAARPECGDHSAWDQLDETARIAAAEALTATSRPSCLVNAVAALLTLLPKAPCWLAARRKGRWPHLRKSSCPSSRIG
jgi:hypothetical protein